MSRQARSRQRRGLGEAGMTLAEVLVSLAILSVVMAGFLGALDSCARSARAQGDLAGTCESLRYSVAGLVRLLRMAGSGGLPLVSCDAAGELQPLALQVMDNADGTTALGGRHPLPGSDVLVIRGALDHRLSDIEGARAIDLAGQEITVPGVSPYSGEAQPLVDGDNEHNRPLLLALQGDDQLTPGAIPSGSRGGYRIVVAAANDPVVVDGGTMTISFVTAGAAALRYNPGGVYTPFPPAAAYGVGLLDELSFFVASNSLGEPALYRHRAGRSSAEEMIPGITDLQIALGCDLDHNGVLQDAEWFHSGAGPAPVSGAALAALREVRLSLVARSLCPVIGPGRSEAWQVAAPENSGRRIGNEPLFRRRIVTVSVALRSQEP